MNQWETGKNLEHSQGCGIVGIELDPNFIPTFCHSKHWRQTQPLLRSNRACVRWLSHRLWTRREESPGQSKVGGIAAKTSLDQLFVQYKCTVMDEINGHYLQLP